MRVFGGKDTAWETQGLDSSLFFPMCFVTLSKSFPLPGLTPTIRWPDGSKWAHHHVNQLSSHTSLLRLDLMTIPVGTTVIACLHAGLCSKHFASTILPNSHINPPYSPILWMGKLRNRQSSLPKITQPAQVRARVRA